MQQCKNHLQVWFLSLSYWPFDDKQMALIFTQPNFDGFVTICAWHILMLDLLVEIPFSICLIFHE